MTDACFHHLCSVSRHSNRNCKLMQGFQITPCLVQYVYYLINNLTLLHPFLFYPMSQSWQKQQVSCLKQKSLELFHQSTEKRRIHSSNCSKSVQQRVFETYTYITLLQMSSFNLQIVISLSTAALSYGVSAWERGNHLKLFSKQ